MVISESKNGEATSYTYGLERISAISGNTRTEYVYDGRGSVAAEVSYNTAWYTFGGGLARKNVVSKSYSPFGELLTEQTSGFGYNGEYYNAATGMIYLRARFYEPEMNRFSQKDTLRGSIIDGISLNRYLYCQSDPVNFADYNGLQMVNVCVADGGGSGRRVTPNQTTPIVTKPGKNSVSYANAASRTVAVPVTDTGTGGYSSAYSAAGAVAGYGNGQGNQGTQTGTSQTSGITRESPSVQDVTGNRGYSCGRDINALGAGDYGQQKSVVGVEGFGGGLSVAWGLAFEGQILIVWDAYGDYAILVSGGVGGGLGASGGISAYSNPNVERVSELNGPGVSIGGTVLFFGTEVSTSMENDVGTSGTVWFKPGLEFHTTITYTTTINIGAGG